MFYHGRIDGQIIATPEPFGETPYDWTEDAVLNAPSEDEAAYAVLNAPSGDEAATLLRDWLTGLARQQMTQLMTQLMGDR
jgi:hypothetical protein